MWWCGWVVNLSLAGRRGADFKSVVLLGNIASKFTWALESAPSGPTAPVPASSEAVRVEMAALTDVTSWRRASEVGGDGRRGRRGGGANDI